MLSECSCNSSFWFFTKWHIVFGPYIHYFSCSFLGLPPLMNTAINYSSLASFLACWSLIRYLLAQLLHIECGPPECLLVSSLYLPVLFCSFVSWMSSTTSMDLCSFMVFTFFFTNLFFSNWDMVSFQPENHQWSIFFILYLSSCVATSWLTPAVVIHLLTVIHSS